MIWSIHHTIQSKPETHPSLMGIRSDDHSRNDSVHESFFFLRIWIMFRAEIAFIANFDGSAFASHSAHRRISGEFPRITVILLPP